EEPPLYAPLGQDHDRGSSFQAHRAAFFFKLERELEKINAFYLEKEAELKLRLETLLSKRRAAAMHVLPDASDDATKNHVEWSAVEEGFRLLERDIGKLQVDGRACATLCSILYMSLAFSLFSNSLRSTLWGFGKSSRSGTSVRDRPPRSYILRVRSRCSRYSTDRYVCIYNDLRFCSTNQVRAADLRVG
ncbi:hypothetical protein BD311DRAFT_653214, partial [Dichomitus squalens]